MNAPDLIFFKKFLLPFNATLRRTQNETLYLYFADNQTTMLVLRNSSSEAAFLPKDMDYKYNFACQETYFAHDNKFLILNRSLLFTRAQTNQTI